MRFVLPSAFAIALAVALVAPRAAEACSCSGSSLDVLLPSPGSLGVPLNARVWVGSGALRFGRGAPGLYLGTDEVPAASTEFWTVRGDRIFVFTPQASLLPRARYEVRQGERVLTSFETGDETDVERPAVPTFAQPALLVENQQTCGVPHTATWSIAHDGLLVVTRGYLASFIAESNAEGGRTGIDESGPSGVIAWATTAQELELGGNGCISNWPEAGPGVQEYFRFGVFDAAGHFSGWSDPSYVRFPEKAGPAPDENADEEQTPPESEPPAADAAEPSADPGAGCSAGANAFSALALLLSLTALRRR